MKTFFLRKEDIKRNWYVIDAKEQILGRLASKVASILRGKHKPSFTPHLDMGDHVVIINADQIKISGKKAEQKTYIHHTGYPGGLKSERYNKIFKENPEKIIRRTVWGMLPHNRLGRKIIKKLKVYSASEHPHQAQKPEPLSL